MADEWKIEGLRELGEALKQFPEKIAGKIMRAAVSSGAAVVRDDAKARAPVDTGEMRLDIQMKHAKGGNAYQQAYEVYVRSGKRSRLAGKRRNIDRDSYYWRFVEFGTVKMTKRPFMRPAFEAKKYAAAEEIRRILAAAVPQVVAMLPGKH
jgi:HK97 gp10 family phage protein